MWNRILYLAAILSLAQAAGLVRLAQAPPDVIGTWRLGLAALCLAPVVLRGKQILPLFAPHQRKLLGTIVISGLFFYFHLWTYFFAVHHTTIARCMIIFAINPVFTAIGAHWFLSEKLDPRFYWSFPLAFAGIGVLVVDQITTTSFTIGDGMALASAFFYAGYILTGRKARLSTTTVNYSFLIYTVAALVFALIASFRGLNLTNYPAATWLAILGTVLIPTFMGHFLFSYLLRFLDPSLMTTGKLLEPIVASLMAVWLFGESLDLNIVLAFALTGSSVVVILHRPPQNDSPKI